ncbi:MAG: c-type cytochrome [Ferruginibacter sp.]
MSFIKRYGIYIFSIILAVVLAVIFIPNETGTYTSSQLYQTNGYDWTPPDLLKLPDSPGADLVQYGRNLIIHTSFYLGPKGSVARLTNGMNCQNCHLTAGTEFLGNNFSAVYSTYPKYRERSGGMETIYKRIADCIQRSLNGTAPDSNSKEMRAINAYIQWLGMKVPKGVKPKGAGLPDIPFLQRAANAATGKMIYIQKCVRCHSLNGEGLLNADSTEYLYPPLWGRKSFNTGAGLFRISRFAAYILKNMPFDIKTNKEIARLSEEEAWDVAGYILSQPRPQKKFANDWPDISKKPYDHPFAPYADTFPEIQHKFGPFEPILKTKKK